MIFKQSQIAGRRTRNGQVQVRNYVHTYNGIGVGDVRYLNILTWFRGFQDKPLYLVVFSLYPSLFWELKGKGDFKKLAILTRKPRIDVRILIHRTWPIEEARKQKPTSFL